VDGSSATGLIGHMSQDVKTLFGQRVRELRTARGLSQEAFAQLAGLDRSYMGGVERGERNISLENICQIAEALQVPPGELFQWAESTSTTLPGR
jgi:transcriptional regulator with XRE-family HTH domain